MRGIIVGALLALVGLWTIWSGLNTYATYDFLAHYSHIPARELWNTFVPIRVILWGMPCVVALLFALVLTVAKFEN